jgi:hypothetical protein
VTADSARRGPLTWHFSLAFTILKVSQLHADDSSLDLTRKRSQVQTLSRPPHPSDQRKRWSASCPEPVWVAA